MREWLEIGAPSQPMTNDECRLLRPPNTLTGPRHCRIILPGPKKDRLNVNPLAVSDSLSSLSLSAGHCAASSCLAPWGRKNVKTI